MTAKKCQKCGKPIPLASGPGRPAVFCGAACRRSAELEIRRINRRIETIETRLSDARISEGAKGPFDDHIISMDGLTDAERTERLAAELRHLERRMLEILQGEGD